LLAVLGSLRLRSRHGACVATAAEPAAEQRREGG
jgi:hypothetical protein